MATHGVQCAASYYLQRQRLEQLWTSIQQSIATDPERFDVFREPQLFLLPKNTKLLFKTTPSRPTIIDAMENFAGYRDRNLDMAHSDPGRFWVDIAKEVCPRASLLAHQRAHVGEEAQVYSWKRCCLENYVNWMYDGAGPAKSGAGQRYCSQNMLRDASTMTSLTPRRHILRRGRIVHSQFYASVKEVWDAMQQAPFEHDGPEELSLDPQIRQAARR